MQENHGVDAASTNVAANSLTAKDILKKVFAYSDSLSEEQILQLIHIDLDSTETTHVNSFGAFSKLISIAAGTFLQRFWFDFQSLNERDQYDVSLVILPTLKKLTAVQLRGRPKGAQSQDTPQRICLAGALRFLGCSRTGMVPFLGPMQNRKKAGKDAVDKFLKRYSASIDREYTNMNQALASKIVKGSLNNDLARKLKLAERIVKSSV